MGRDARNIAFGEYIDFFSTGAPEPLAEPRVLPDGTSIQWPEGWRDVDAFAWRKAHHLLPPDVEHQSRLWEDRGPGHVVSTHRR